MLNSFETARYELTHLNLIACTQLNIAIVAERENWIKTKTVRITACCIGGYLIKQY